nr:hypothetical protein [Tanacetum cinerariifolium]
KLFKDLKELAEYDQSTSTDRPIFLNSDEGHYVQDKESLENPFNEITDNESDLESEATTDTELSSTEDIHPLAVQESPHDSDICQLIRKECCIEFLCMHNNVDDLIESALDSKLLSISSINSQRLDKKEQEVKKVEEQPAGRRNHAEKSLQNFRVIHKSSISFKNTSQISSIHSIAPIQSTKEPEHLLSMGYKHFSITPETESDEVKESNAENLLPIPSKCEVTLEDEIECDMPAKDVCSPVFTIFSNPLFKDNDNFDSSDDESLPDEDVGYNPSISRPPLEPSDNNFDLEPEVISAVMEDIDEPDEHFNPGGEIFVSTNNEDVDYFPFMFVIRIFLPYLILPEISPLLLSAESEDTIFDPGIFD